MAQQKLKLILFFVFLFAVTFGASARVKADEPAGIKLQPSVIEEKVEPGQTLSWTIHATNIGSQTRTFYVIRRDISSISSEGNPVFAEAGGKTGFELSSWINITKEGIEIPAGATKDIPFSVVVPKDAGPGGHFGVIFLATSAERPKETGAGIGYQVGTIISLRVSGAITEEAQIREFRTDRTIYDKPEVKFITRVENLGNVVLKPRGPLEITDWWGKKVASLNMNDDAAAVLPKSARTFAVSWLGEGLVFGRYQAVMTLTYGDDGKQNLSSALSFWVLPKKTILLFGGGLLGTILLVLILIKLHIRKKIAELGQSADQNLKSQEMPRQRTALDNISRLIMLVVALAILSALLAWFIGL